MAWHIYNNWTVHAFIQSSTYPCAARRLTVREAYGRKFAMVLKMAAWLWEEAAPGVHSQVVVLRQRVPLENETEGNHNTEHSPNNTTNKTHLSPRNRVRKLQVFSQSHSAWGLGRKHVVVLNMTACDCGRLQRRECTSRWLFFRQHVPRGNEIEGKQNREQQRHLKQPQ